MDHWGEFLASLRYDQIGYAGVVLWIVWAILTGKLVPRAAVDEIRRERDDWKDVSLELMQQNSAIIGAARTTEKVVASLPEVGGTQ